jgi:phytoene desaturase
MLHRRVPHRAPFADGAWFVGGATHPGSGLPVIFLSAQITAGMLLSEIGLDASGMPVGPRESTPASVGAPV